MHTKMSLYSRDGSLFAQFSSEEGVRQGAVEAPYLFSMVFNELFHDVSFHLTTYLDDIIVFLSHSDDVDSVIHEIQVRLLSVGLTLNLHKSAIITKRPSM